jgi:hypothetical protein
MTAGGWIFMLISVGLVIGLTAWCYYRVFTAPAETTEPPETLGG